MCLAFLQLGLTSFGGPVAHPEYFRAAFVERRRWIDKGDDADLVAPCQFLPGPASSQVGLAIGRLRAGCLVAFAAFLAFTLPSAMLLVLFGQGADAFGGPVGKGIVSGLTIVAVAIVAHAVRGMAGSLCPDHRRATVALAPVLLVVALAGSKANGSFLRHSPESCRSVFGQKTDGAILSTRPVHSPPKPGRTPLLPSRESGHFEERKQALFGLRSAFWGLERAEPSAFAGGFNPKVREQTSWRAAPDPDEHHVYARAL